MMIASEKSRSTAPPKEEQTENRDQRDGAGQDGPAERLIDALVHDLFDRAAPPAGQTFTDSIVDDDRVVDRIAGDGEHSADHGEGQFAVQAAKTLPP